MFPYVIQILGTSFMGTPFNTNQSSDFENMSTKDLTACGGAGLGAIDPLRAGNTCSQVWSEEMGRKWVKSVCQL